MAIKLSASHRVRVSHPSTFSFRATGIPTDLAQTWFLLGFKRTPGDPATVADLVDKVALQFFEGDSGSYTFLEATGTCTCQMSLVGGASYPAALAGDHMFLLVTSGTTTPPFAEATFDAKIPLGLLKT